MNTKTSIIVFIVLFLISSALLYFLFSHFKIEKIDLDFPDFKFSEDEEIDIKDFYGSPVIAGSLIKIDDKKLILYLETYDSSQKKDIVCLIQITEKTIFTKKSKTAQEPLILGNYEGVFGYLLKDTPLAVTVKDVLEETPEAIVVEINADYPSFFEPAELDINI